MEKYTVLAILLIVTTTLALNATIKLKVDNAKVYLLELTARKSYITNSKLAENVIESNLMLESQISQKDGYVSESFSSSGKSEMKSSLLKRSNVNLDFSLLSNETSANIDLRLRGSLLVSLIYIRNSDLLISVSINKNKKEGELTLKGFVSLTTPVTTIKNLLKLQVPRIRSSFEKSGIKVVKLEYKVTGRKIPPMSTVKLNIVLLIKKSDLESLLDKFGLGYLTSYLNITDNVTRTVTGHGYLRSTVKTIKVNGLPEFHTIISFKASAKGKYYNTTVVNELKNRLSILNKLLNLTNVSNYLGGISKSSMMLNLAYAKGKSSVDAKFNNLYFMNNKGFWQTIYEIAKKEGIRVLVLCNGQTMILNSPTPPCK